MFIVVQCWNFLRFAFLRVTDCGWGGAVFGSGCWCWQHFHHCTILSGKNEYERQQALRVVVRPRCWTRSGLYEPPCRPPCHCPVKISNIAHENLIKHGWPRGFDADTVPLLNCTSSLQRSKFAKGTSVEDRVSQTMGKVAPSILLSGLAESLAFFLGTYDCMIVHISAHHSASGNRWHKSCSHLWVPFAELPTNAIWFVCAVWKICSSRLKILARRKKRAVWTRHLFAFRLQQDT